MRTELLQAFDTLAPHCEVSATLCEAAARGALDEPSIVHDICTRLRLPKARAADLERALSAGQVCRLFEKTKNFTWRVRDRALAGELAPLLQGARLYCRRVHQDIDVVDVVLTKPPAPSQISAQLESMLQGTRSFRDTRQLLPAIAESARRSFGVMTPFFDEVGAQVVVNLFKRTVADDRYLILRTTKEGVPPPALTAVREELSCLGVAVLNFRLDRSDMRGNETFHAKVVLADDTAAYVGSSNMNQWSFEYSLELGLYVQGLAAARVGAVLQAARAVSGPMGVVSQIH